MVRTLFTNFNVTWLNLPPPTPNTISVNTMQRKSYNHDIYDMIKGGKRRRKERRKIANEEQTRSRTSPVKITANCIEKCKRSNWSICFERSLDNARSTHSTLKNWIHFLSFIGPITLEIFLILRISLVLKVDFLLISYAYFVTVFCQIKYTYI